MDSLLPLLEQIGLQDKEATVYLELLQLGEAPVTVIAQRTRIARSTVQFTCQQLAKKGVVRIVVRNRMNIFTPEPPEKLALLLHRERTALSEKEAALDRAMGTLKSLVNPDANLPKVEYYEGKGGLIELYDKILDLRSPIDSFEDKGEMVQFIPEYVQTFIRTRKERGIFNKVICAADNTVNISTPAELRETRTIRTEEFPFTCDIKVCADLVSIFSFAKHSPVGIAIRHKEIAENFRTLHATMWRLLER